MSRLFTFLAFALCLTIGAPVFADQEAESMLTAQSHRGEQVQRKSKVKGKGKRRRRRRPPPPPPQAPPLDETPTPDPEPEPPSPPDSSPTPPPPPPPPPAAPVPPTPPAEPEIPAEPPPAETPPPAPPQPEPATEATKQEPTPLEESGADPGRTDIVIEETGLGTPRTNSAEGTIAPVDAPPPQIIEDATGGDASALEIEIVEEPAKDARGDTPRYSRWEHMCVKTNRSNLTSTLNDAGRNGWQLTRFGTISEAEVSCFKRPIGRAQ